MTDTARALRGLLDEALDALAGGDATEAERRAKAVSALVRAARHVAELEAASGSSTEEDAESKRAELRRRVALFFDASRAGAPDDVLERIGRGHAPR